MSRRISPYNCNVQGYQMVNPREDEPLRFLQIDPETGAIVVLAGDDETVQRGQHTIDILKLNERPDLDRQRQELYLHVLDWISEIVDPDTSRHKIEYAWSRLQGKLHERQSYLAIIQQLFTRPSDEEATLIQRLYEIKPEAHDFFADFRRPL